ncbi:helix-turn-helix domain-containing protein [Streptosporangium roseum]|uniref:helix-turn-helix domain-containing protein n=1 Tax=Streptosporangium roseum TaxID=2001 RepID=UPI0018CBFD22|nr:helix-turn-helix transcriptional regulator [Streptosporangium roseum]
MAWSTIRRGTRLERAVRALVQPLAQRLEERGHTHTSIAEITQYSRTTVSRVLSGRVVPSSGAVTAIASALGYDVQQTLRRWEKVEAIRQKQRCALRAQRNTSVSPADITSYSGLLEGLRQLMRRNGLSQNRLSTMEPSLKRSTLGAVLRGDRSLRRDTVIVIMRACQVSDLREVSGWLAAWERLGQPDMLRRQENRLRGYRRRRKALALEAVLELVRRHGSLPSATELRPRRRWSA